MKEKKKLMIDYYVLNKVLDKIKAIISIENFNNSKI